MPVSSFHFRAHASPGSGSVLCMADARQPVEKAICASYSSVCPTSLSLLVPFLALDRQRIVCRTPPGYALVTLSGSHNNRPCPSTAASPSSKGLTGASGFSSPHGFASCSCCSASWAFFSYRLAETIEHYKEDDENGKLPILEVV